MLCSNEMLAMLAALLIARWRRLAIAGRRYLSRWLPDRHLANARDSNLNLCMGRMR